MGYEGVTLGPSDLKLPAGELLAMVVNDPNKPSPFVSANVGLFAFDAGMLSPYRIVAAGGRKIGITGVLGKSFQKQVINNDVVMSDPETALKAILPEMQKKADYLVLLANADMKESTELAEKFPQFNVVVTAGGEAEPPAKPLWLNGGKTCLVEVGEKGMNAVVLGLFPGGKPMRYQRCRWIRVSPPRPT